MTKELTLEQRLSMLLSALEESAGVTVAIQGDFARQLRELEAERDQLRKGAEQERAKLARMSGELVQSVGESARKAATDMVTSVSQTAALALKIEHQPLLNEIKAATAKTDALSSEAKTALENLKVGWKEHLLRLVVSFGAGALVLGLMAWLTVGWSRDETQKEQDKRDQLAKEAEELRGEHKAMKAEMDAWKESKAGQTKLEPCPAPIDHLKCVRVDKTRGALGKGKDLFVPASVN